MDRINEAKSRLHDAKWNLTYTRRDLANATVLANRSAFRFYVWPALWAVAGAVVIWWGSVNAPTAGMDTGGNWGWGTVVMGTFLVLMSLAGVFDARSRRDSAPGQVKRHTAEIAHLEQSIIELTAKVEEEKAEYERRRLQPDAAMTLLGLLGQQAIRQLPEGDELTAELRGVVEGYTDAEWEAFALRVGSERATKLRSAHESLRLSNRVGR